MDGAAILFRLAWWLTRLVGRLGVLTPQTLMLGNCDVAEDVALASQPKTPFGMVGWKAKAPEFCGSGIRNRTFDANGARAASAVTPAVDRACDSRVERKAGPQKNNAEIRSARAFNGLASEVDCGQMISRCRPTGGYVARSLLLRLRQPQHAIRQHPKLLQAAA